MHHQWCSPKETQFEQPEYVVNCSVRIHTRDSRSIWRWILTVVSASTDLVTIRPGLTLSLWPFNYYFVHTHNITYCYVRLQNILFALDLMKHSASCTEAKKRSSCINMVWIHQFFHTALCWLPQFGKLDAKLCITIAILWTYKNIVWIIV